MIIKKYIKYSHIAMRGAFELYYIVMSPRQAEAIYASQAVGASE
jgi:hypothetical protein